MANSFKDLAEHVKAMETEADRVSTIDLLSPFSVACVQYVDDNIFPAASLAQSCVIWHACETYSMEHGPRFRLGKNKSAIMPNSHTFVNPVEGPMYFAIPVPIVSSYTYMGILLDPDFTFQPHLEKTLAKWSQAFDKLVGVCSSQGLPFLFTATRVPERVESVALYGLAFCIGVPSAESTLPVCRRIGQKRC